jgi:hypothetical protein
MSATSSRRIAPPSSYRGSPTMGRDAEDRGQLLDLVLVHDREHLVAGLEGHLAARDDDLTLADDGGDDGLGGQGQVAQGDPHRARSRLDLVLDQRVASAAELEQRHHLAQRHLLLDEAGQDLRLVHGHVHVEVGVEEPGVARVVDGGDGPRHE